MNRPVLTQSCSRKKWNMVNPCRPNTFYIGLVPWPAAGAAGLVRQQHCLLRYSPNWAALSHTVLTQIRCYGRASGACWNGTGMARNRASIYRYAVICQNMHKYANTCTEYANICQKYAHEFRKYATICRGYANICKKYAENMHRICTEYAQNMHLICKYMQKICRKYARNMQEICKKYAEKYAVNMQ